MVKSATEVRGDVSVVKVGDFKVNVSYECQDDLRTISKKPAGILFKFSAVRYDASSGKVQAYATPLDLSRYNLIPAFR